MIATLGAFVNRRIRAYTSGENVPQDWNSTVQISLGAEYPQIARFIEEHRLNAKEQLLLLLVLAPHFEADFYDRIVHTALPEAGDFPLFGGTRGKNFRGFLPTGETALFLLAGKDRNQRLAVQQLFHEEHLFAKKHILWLDEVPEGEPRMSGRIVLSQDCVDLLTTGREPVPRFSMSFPAQLLETELTWDDLVLPEETTKQIDELIIWANCGQTLMNDWGMHRTLKPGYRALFYGPPGTGKTLTACLLGKRTNRPVYRVDLSMVVSKYIGETEKNLANLFARAENKQWIIFFDEADSIFSPRTETRHANDKYANQEVSYLLQRLESCPGIVILASNFRSNIDTAFSRRFQSIVSFPAPGVSERLKLWKNAFPEKAQLGPDINIQSLAQGFELTGAEIVNVVQYACLQALSKAKANDPVQIRYADIYNGIKREYQKEGKILR